MAAKMYTPGEVLQDRRIKLKKSLEEVSQETKIQIRYLEQIEKNEFDKFESDIFVSGFIKIYAQYLSLDVDKVLALYRRVAKERKEKGIKKSEPVQRKKSLSEKLKGIFTPSNIIYAILTVAVIGIIAYLSVQFYDFQRPPELTVTSPEDGITVEEPEIVIEGFTEKGSLIQVNGVQIEIENDYSFSVPIELVEGSNTITVSASRSGQTDKETVIARNVKYVVKVDAEVVEETPEPEEPTTKTVRLVVTTDAAWVQLNIDDRQEVANVIGPNFSEEYEITESFEVITGRPTITEIYYNDVKQEIPIDTVQGIGRLYCSLNRSNLNCE